MYRIKFIKIALMSLLFASALISCKINRSEKAVETVQTVNIKPNVIIILTDDQGYGDLSMHGNPILKTPYTDKLGSESVRFTDFHVAPMCTPTRSQLMTGVDAMRNGATAVCQGHSMMFQDIPLMPAYFKKSGYATGLFGKWHLGDSYPHRPQDNGFDETLSFRAWGITSLADHFGNDYFDPYLRHNGEEKKYDGYSTDIFFSEAKKWIKEKKDNNEPFFLYLPTNTPHVPEIVSETYSKFYKSRTHNGVEVPAEFYGMIANIDDNLKSLDVFLEQEHLRDNTILIYLSDNGTQNKNAQEIFNYGMRGGKTSMFDGGHRVPLFIRWPKGGFTHNRDLDALVQVQDILPTLMDLCGLESVDSNIDMNGKSFYSLLNLGVPEAQAKFEDRKIVLQYSFHETSGAKWKNAVVLWKKWRLVGPNKLFNIEKDPSQQSNIIKEHPEIANSMKEHYEEWYKEAKPRFDKQRLISIGNEKTQFTELFSNDWDGGYCDNLPGLVAANTTGVYYLDIKEAGEYEFELRRWPDEIDLPIASGIEGSLINAHETFEGYVGERPIRFAEIEIQDFKDSKVVAASDKYVKFTANLKKGKTTLKTLFLGADKKVLCSAIYIDVKKIVKL